jgi:hypothetical protein
VAKLPAPALAAAPLQQPPAKESQQPAKVMQPLAKESLPDAELDALLAELSI